MEAIEYDILRIANQLLLYSSSKMPDEDLWKNTGEIADDFLTALLENHTYVFNYRNLQDTVSGDGTHEHIGRILDNKQDEINLLCKIVFPEHGPVKDILYFTSTQQRFTKGHDRGAVYAHLIVPNVNEKLRPKIPLEITPRCLGLHTIVRPDPEHEEGIYIDLCTVNEALQKDYNAIQGTPLDYLNLYHRTLFSMTYALENLLCARADKSFLLPADSTGKRPEIAYTKVKILEQPDSVH